MTVTDHVTRPAHCTALVTSSETIRGIVSTTSESSPRGVLGQESRCSTRNPSMTSLGLGCTWWTLSWLPPAAQGPCRGLLTPTVIQTRLKGIRHCAGGDVVQQQVPSPAADGGPMAGTGPGQYTAAFDTPVVQGSQSGALRLPPGIAMARCQACCNCRHETAEPKPEPPLPPSPAAEDHRDTGRCLEPSCQPTRRSPSTFALASQRQAPSWCQWRKPSPGGPLRYLTPTRRVARRLSGPGQALDQGLLQPGRRDLSAVQRVVHRAVPSQGLRLQRQLDRRLHRTRRFTASHQRVRTAHLASTVQTGAQLPSVRATRAAPV